VSGSVGMGGGGYDVQNYSTSLVETWLSEWLAMCEWECEGAGVSGSGRRRGEQNYSTKHDLVNGWPARRGV
jgi:hypothetical protein